MFCNLVYLEIEIVKEHKTNSNSKPNNKWADKLIIMVYCILMQWMDSCTCTSTWIIQNH